MIDTPSDVSKVAKYCYSIDKLPLFNTNMDVIIKK